MAQVDFPPISNTELLPAPVVKNKPLWQPWQAQEA